MGANYISASIPHAEMTDERMTSLRRMFDALQPNDIEPEWREDEDYLENLKEAIEALPDMAGRRDVGVNDQKGILVTGGMSWGDNPTEAFGYFDMLNQCIPIRKILHAWANDDYGMADECRVWIAWGQHDKQEPVCYEFDTPGEVNAFLKGISEAMDWNDWEQFDTEEEATAWWLEHKAD